MTYRALVVADDLTGAMDTGTEFAARGAETVVALSGTGSGEGNRIESDVLVADTDSRSVGRRTAARAVTRAIDAYPAKVVYKKVDSTLRGNLVVETDAAIDATGATLVLFAPAFPATGRTTEEGTHLVEGVPVAETFDESGELATSHLPTLLASSSYPVVTCSTARIEQGPEAIDERLSGIERPAIVACDASTEAHLDAIARAGATASDGGERMLYVGSAGLARHVRLPEESSDAATPTDDTKPGGGPTNDASTGSSSRDDESANGAGTAGERTVFGVAGSANPRTIEQIETLPPQQVIALDVERAVHDPDAAATAASARATTVLTAGETAVVTSVPDPGAIERAREASAAVGVKRVGDRIECALAVVTEAVCMAVPLDGLVLTGGAVAVRVLRELDASAIRLTGETIERGVPIGAVVGGQAAGVVVITKAGGFGDERTIANCLAHLREANEQLE